jgi:hypothetical protein
MITDADLRSQVFYRDYVDARWLFRKADIESPSDSGYRAACGVSGCVGYLGLLIDTRGYNAQLPTIDELEAWRTEAPENDSEPEWELIRPAGARGFRPDPGDLPWVFRVWRLSDAARNNKHRDAEQEGRRLTPDMGEPKGVYRKREIVGNAPTLPCVIVCAECGAPNVVTLPRGMVN